MELISRVTKQYVSFERPIGRVRADDVAGILRQVSRALGMDLTGRKVGAFYVIERDGVAVARKRRLDSALSVAIGRDVVVPRER